MTMGDPGVTTTRATVAPGRPDPVSVLIVHDRYRQAGGEDAVVANEAALLRGHGHRVSELIVDNDAIPDRSGPLAKARLAANTVWSFSAASAVRHRIEREHPDVVHVHNVLPLLSPAVLAAAHASGAAVVQTVHNYRLVCPAGTLFRDGRPCDDCVGLAIPLPAIAHACYRSSRARLVSSARRGWPSGFVASQRISPTNPTSSPMRVTRSRIVISEPTPRLIGSAPS